MSNILCNPNILRKAARAIYLACEESVAKDIADKFNWAADEIDRLRKLNPIGVNELSYDDEMFVERLIIAVCEAWNITVDQFKSSRKPNDFIWPRHAARWIVRDNYGWTYQKIGAAFNRDHGSIIESVKLVEDLRLTDPRFCVKVGEATQALFKTPTEQEQPTHWPELPASSSGQQA